MDKTPPSHHRPIPTESGKRTRHRLGTRKNPLSAVIRVPMESHGKCTAIPNKGGKRREPSSLRAVKRAGVCGEPAAKISPSGFSSVRTWRMQSLLRGEQRPANQSLPVPATYLLYLLAIPGPSSKRLIMGKSQLPVVYINFVVYSHTYFSLHVCFHCSHVNTAHLHQYRKKDSPGSPDKAGLSHKVTLDASTNYILFSPTHLAAVRKKAELQRSLQNHSVSVLTIPTGLEASNLPDTLTQQGEAKPKPPVGIMFKLRLGVGGLEQLWLILSWIYQYFVNSKRVIRKTEI